MHLDYKQHKQNKRQGGIGYVEEEPKVVRGKKRGKYKCKKSKGEHEWEFKEEHKHSFMNDSYYFYVCKLCGKEDQKPKHKYVCQVCGHDKEWLWHVLGSMSETRKCRKCGSKDIKKVLNPI